MRLFHHDSTLYISVGCESHSLHARSPDFDITVMELGGDPAPMDVFPGVQVVPIVIYPIESDSQSSE